MLLYNGRWGVEGPNLAPLLVDTREEAERLYYLLTAAFAAGAQHGAGACVGDLLAGLGLAPEHVRRH